MWNKLSPEARNQLIADAITEASRRKNQKPVMVPFELPQKDRNYTLHRLAREQVSQRLASIPRYIEQLLNYRADNPLAAEYRERLQYLNELASQIEADYEAGQITDLERQALLVPKENQSPEARDLFNRLWQLDRLYVPYCLGVGMPHNLMVVSDSGQLGRIYLHHDESGQWWQYMNYKRPEGWPDPTLDSNGVEWLS